MKSSEIDEMLSKICLDERISSGIFNLDDNDHIKILIEYLENGIIEKSKATLFINKMLEGKFPQRQAYNSDGLLVTFPTPEYKQRAIGRGTHFEENPKKGQANIFQAPTPNTSTPPSVQSPETTQSQPTPNIFQPDPSVSVTSAPVQSSSPTDQKDLTAPVATEKDTRTPEEKVVDAKAVQQILSTAPASIDIAMKYPNLESVMKTIKEAIRNNEISSVTLHF